MAAFNQEPLAGAPSTASNCAWGSRQNTLVSLLGAPCTRALHLERRYCLVLQALAEYPQYRDAAPEHKIALLEQGVCPPGKLTNCFQILGLWVFDTFYVAGPPCVGQQWGGATPAAVPDSVTSPGRRCLRMLVLP